MKRTLLEGIRVVDFGWVQTGPQTGQLLSDCGAEVIKVEGRSRPDTIRRSRTREGATGFNVSPTFNRRNTNKLSLALNLGRPEGKQIARKLIAKSDVVVENFAFGALDRMGLGYQELKKDNPGIIVLASNGLGHSGPFADNPAHGSVLAGLAGISQIAGWPDRYPPSLGFYTDYIGPRFNAIAIVAALEYRARTGEGMYIDNSQYEVSLHFMAPLILDYAVNGRIANRMGNRSTYAAPHGAYRCKGKDRWCSIAVFNDKEWQSFCKVIGNPSWTKNSEFSTFLARKKNEDELDKLVEQWTLQHTPEEVMNLMQPKGVAAGVVATGEDLLEHNPQLEAQHFFWTLDHPEMGKYRALREPFKPSKARYELRRAPLLGEHNEYVLKEIIGMTDSEISKLVGEGIVE